jgi:hypothetical protein
LLKKEISLNLHAGGLDTIPGIFGDSGHTKTYILSQLVAERSKTHLFDYFIDFEILIVRISKRELERNHK